MLKAGSSNVSIFNSRSLLTALLGVGLSLSMACGKTTQALVVVNSESQEQAATQTSLSEMAEADVLYLGERHDSEADHQSQLELIKAMHQENPKLAIGLEMIQRPFQKPLDDYIAGKIDEAKLIELTEYEQRWGFPWELYAPIFRYAREHKLPILALNTPREVSKKIAREGLESLSEDELKYIPEISEIDTSNEAYRAYVTGAFGGHGAHGNFNFDNFFAAQVTWDETMAEAIANFKEKEPETQVVVLAGQGHVIYGFGIPSRVKRRLPEVQQKLVILNPSEGVKKQAIATQDRLPIADILWYGPSKSSP